MLIAAIPVRNAFIWTRDLVTTLLHDDDVDELWLFDNGSTDETSAWAASLARNDSRLIVSDRPNARLYGMWNEMISRASLKNDAKLAILNNDIRMRPKALTDMRVAMEGYDLAFIDRDATVDVDGSLAPRPCSWQERTGWAFMVRADFWKHQAYAIDPGLRIWWGDDDLARRASVRGARLCIVQGLGCHHHESQTLYPGDLQADVEHDREYFAKLWSTWAGRIESCTTG